MLSLFSDIREISAENVQRNGCIAYVWHDVQQTRLHAEQNKNRVLSHFTC